jgi:hypothetical protein
MPSLNESVERDEKAAGLAEQTDLHLTIEGEDAGSASRQTQTLERLLLEQCPLARIRRIRTDAEKMDGGATLAIVLASPVLVELVKTVRAFLLQRRAAKISVKKGQNSFTIEGASEQQMTALLDFLRSEK